MTENRPMEAPPIGEAEYLLESPLKCSCCNQLISSVFIVRLLRVRVNFVSSLPRRGHVVVCPLCQGILSAELGGMA